MPFRRVLLASGLLFGALMGHGCVLPQNDNYLSQPPVLVNRPPRIIEAQALPTNRLTFTGNALGSGPATACQIRFSIQAAVDDDLCDTLQVGWIVDRQPGTATWAQAPIGIPNPPGGSAVRSLVGADFTPDVSLATSPLHDTSKPHIVEAVVSDGQIVLPSLQPLSRDIFEQCIPKSQGGDLTLTLADGGEGFDQTYGVTYAWTVVTSNTVCQ